MKHLVLGSSGQVGYHLVNILKQHNQEVLTFDIIESPDQDLRVYNNILLEEKIKEYAKYIPFAGELIEFWHFGHKILFGYAVFEIIKEVSEGLGSAIKNITNKTEIKESLLPEFIRM